MINNGQIKTSQGTIKNLNSKKINGKKKIYKTRAVALTAAAIMLFSILAFKYGSKNKEITVPDDQLMITITMQIEDGDTFSEIASRYFSENCEGVYNSVSDFERAIQKANKKYSSHIESGDTLKIPVIIDKNNSIYLEILDIKNKIEQIQNNDLWVRYTVKSGDSFSSVAQLSSGSISETYENMSEIMSKNNMNSKTLLREGQVIWIMNPELGALKMQLGDLQDKLTESLVVSQTKK